MNPVTDPTKASDIAAELAALGEAELDVDEAAWLAAQASRVDGLPSAGERSVGATPVAAELSHHSLQRVWTRIERRWWHQRINQRLRVVWHAARSLFSFAVSPHPLAWTSAAAAVLIIGVSTLDSPPDRTRDDDDLAALGAIARAQLNDRQPQESQPEGDESEPSPDLTRLPPMLWTQAIAEPPNPPLRNEPQP
jgi:hypothetical protein